MKVFWTKNVWSRNVPKGKQYKNNVWQKSWLSETQMLFI